MLDGLESGAVKGVLGDPGRQRDADREAVLGALDDDRRLALDLDADVRVGRRDGALVADPVGEGGQVDQTGVTGVGAIGELAEVVAAVDEEVARDDGEHVGVGDGCTLEEDAGDA